MKFYKITNEEEIHHGLQYHTGLVEDILPFDPSGDCGIYFASKDILVYLYYGPWIREVTIPEGELVYENPGYPKEYSAHRVILGERRRINVDVVRELVEEGADIHVRNDAALCFAALYGYLDIIKYFVEEGADIHAHDDLALRWAALQGHLDVVKYLVEQGADIHVDNDDALCWAAEQGHLDVIKYLVEHGADIHAHDNLALRWALRRGYPKIFEYIVEQTNQRCQTN